MRIKTAKDIGNLVKNSRKAQRLTQAKLAQLCNVGVRFIVELEGGKPTCQLEKTLKVLNNLGVKIETNSSFEASHSEKARMEAFKEFMQKFETPNPEIKGNTDA